MTGDPLQLRLLGWPEDGPRLALDHEVFAYAGNFATGRTGIAAAVPASEAGAASAPVADTEPAVDPEAVLAAASFDADRAAADALRIRYVSVRGDHRGEGIGPRLCAFVVEQALDRGFERVRIGVNNPIAYRALYRAGFGFTGEESGMGELVLEAPPPIEDRSAEPNGHGDRAIARYRDGFERFASRDLPESQRTVLERHRDGEPPPVVTPPRGSSGSADGPSREH